MRVSYAGLTLLALASSTAPCRANGFMIYEMSAEAMGRACAVSADVTEAAAIWFNPASLAFLEGSSAQVGGVWITARSRFEDAETGAQTSSDRGNFILPTIFGHSTVADGVAVGVGVYSAFGIGLTWPDDWQGRESSISASLKTVTVNPSVAVRLHPLWSVALGLDVVRSAVDLKTGLPAPLGGQLRLGGGTWGFGANAGVLYRALPNRLHVGLAYRSRVKLGFEGEADFAPANRDFERSLPDQPGNADVTLPDVVTLGILFRPHRDIALGFDVNAVFWSTYDRVDIDFESAPDRAIIPDAKDTFQLRAGGDFRLAPTDLHVRGGIIFDRTAIHEEGLGPRVPDSDRIDVSAGLGYVGDVWKVDLGAMLVMFLPADARSGREGPEGTYHSYAHLVGLTLGARF